MSGSKRRGGGRWKRGKGNDKASSLAGNSLSSMNRTIEERSETVDGDSFPTIHRGGEGGKPGDLNIEQVRQACQASLEEELRACRMAQQATKGHAPSKQMEALLSLVSMFEMESSRVCGLTILSESIAKKLMGALGGAALRAVEVLLMVYNRENLKISLGALLDFLQGHQGGQDASISSILQVWQPRHIIEGLRLRETPVDWSPRDHTLAQAFDAIIWQVETMRTLHLIPATGNLHERILVDQFIDARLPSKHPLAIDRENYRRTHRTDVRSHTMAENARALDAATTGATVFFPCLLQAAVASQHELTVAEEQIEGHTIPVGTEIGVMGALRARNKLPATESELAQTQKDMDIEFEINLSNVKDVMSLLDYASISMSSFFPLSPHVKQLIEDKNKVNLYSLLPPLVQLAILHSRHGCNRSFYQVNTVSVRHAATASSPADADMIEKQSRLLLLRVLEMAGARQTRGTYVKFDAKTEVTTILDLYGIGAYGGSRNYLAPFALNADSRSTLDRTLLPWKFITDRITQYSASLIDPKEAERQLVAYTKKAVSLGHCAPQDRASQPKLERLPAVLVNAIGKLPHKDLAAWAKKAKSKDSGKRKQAVSEASVKTMVNSIRNLSKASSKSGTKKDQPWKADKECYACGVKGHIKSDGICKDDDVRSFKRAKTNHVGLGSESEANEEVEEEEEESDSSGT